MRSNGFIALLAFLGGLTLLIALPIVLSLGFKQGPVQSQAATVSPTKQLGDPVTSQPVERLYQQPSVECTVDITTTDKPPSGNTTIQTAAAVANYTGQSLVEDVNVPGNPVQATTHSDFYRLDNALVNYRYTLQAKPDRTTNYNLGIIIYNRDRQAIYTDTDTSNYQASIAFEATNEGPYYFEIFQVSEQCSGGTYNLIYSSPTAPTPTNTPTNTPFPSTPTPQPTWPSGFDQYEPNYDFDTATTIAPGLTYNLNFMPWGGWSEDNDFFRIRVKPGLMLSCETSDLDPGVDPNMIFYSRPDLNAGVASNDDISLLNFNSRVSYYVNYEGYIYILVGQGGRMSPADAANSNYKLTCEYIAPGTPIPGDDDTTPVPGATATPAPDKDPIRPPATATPRPPTSTSPIATPTPEADETTDLTFQLLTTPVPVTPTPTPTGFRSFRFMAYYDDDLDGQPGAGEGIPGFYVRVLSVQTGEELARGYTDEQGQISFTVPTVDTVRVLVPLLGFDQLVSATTPEVIVRIAPPALPETIPY